MYQEPRYLREVLEYVQTHLEEPTSLLAALCALLTDPDSYKRPKRQPLNSLTDFVGELALTNRPLQDYLRARSPVTRELLDGKWVLTWKGVRHEKRGSGFTFDACISFAGVDRAVAEEIAASLAANGMNRRVFYDDFENVTLWGEDLFAYLYDVYANKSMYCIILFSHAYRQRAWTRHELRASQTRTLAERTAYVLPVELDLGAVPEEFANVGYWPFKPGDGLRIADAVEDKINQYASQFYLTAEEIGEKFTLSAIRSGILAGFRVGIRQAQSEIDPQRAQALAVLAVIAGADTHDLQPDVRSLVDLIVFSGGSIGDLFVDDEVLANGDAGKMLRRLGPDGPLMLKMEGWEQHLGPVIEGLERLREWSDDGEPTATD